MEMASSECTSEALRALMHKAIKEAYISGFYSGIVEDQNEWLPSGADSWDKSASKAEIEAALGITE